MGGSVDENGFWHGFRAVSTASDGRAFPSGMRSRSKTGCGPCGRADGPGRGRGRAPAEGAAVPGDRGRRGAVGERGCRESAHCRAAHDGRRCLPGVRSLLDGGHTIQRRLGMTYRTVKQPAHAYLQEMRTYPRPVTTRAPSPRSVAGWILRRPENLTDSEGLRLKTVRTHCPEPDALTRHVRSFAIMLADRKGERLPEWLAEVRQDDLPASTCSPRASTATATRHRRPHPAPELRSRRRPRQQDQDAQASDVRTRQFRPPAQASPACVSTYTGSSYTSISEGPRASNSSRCPSTAASHSSRSASVS